MKKILFIIFALAFGAMSCSNNNSEKKSDAKSAAVAIVVSEPTVVDLVSFDDQAGDLIGKNIKISGTVDHVCEHGGQKLFIVTENSDVRLKIVPNEQLAAFNTELVGENIELTGLVEEQRVDEDYLKEWEEEIKADKDEGQGKGIHLDGEGKVEHEEDVNPDFEKINTLRKMLAESGDDHLSFYTVVCSAYTVVDNKAIEE